MNCTLSKILIFAAGAAFGSAVSWKILKEKYERITRDEIASVKEHFSKRNRPRTDMEELRDTLLQCGYSSKSEKKEEGEKKPMKESNIRIISPDEYGECDYDTRTYTYYANGILTDEYDEVVDDIEGTVGSDAFEHFGDHEKDTVFVRNDDLGIDYEILRDLSEYVPYTEG